MDVTTEVHVDGEETVFCDWTDFLIDLLLRWERGMCVAETLGIEKPLTKTGVVSAAVVWMSELDTQLMQISQSWLVFSQFCLYNYLFCA